MGSVFATRREAGETLATKLAKHTYRRCARAGAAARRRPCGLRSRASSACPLDVFVVRKLGVPGYEELAMGAIPQAVCAFVKASGSAA